MTDHQPLVFPLCPLWSSAFSRVIVPIGILLATATASADTLRVGPTREIRDIATAARLARDGDVVEIDAGEYRGDVASWRQRRLTIRGVGGRPVLLADGRDAEGKAIWVVKDGEFLIENIEFRGARVEDGDGNGIRFERGRLTVRHCRFADNQIGLMTANTADAELTVEDSEFADAPPPRKLPHLLYVGRIARFTLRGSRIEGGHTGHLVKSRARVSDVRYNFLVDGPAGRASYELEFPNGGRVVVVGNVIGQSARTGNSTLVSYGAEGPYWPDNAFLLAHNTLISEAVDGRFVRVWQEKFAQPVELRVVNNLTVGTGVFGVAGNGAAAGNRSALFSMLRDPAGLDFSLRDDAGLAGRGVDPQARGAPPPEAEFRAPLGTRAIRAPRRWTPGAYQ